MAAAPIRVALAGAGGRMGRAVTEAIAGDAEVALECAFDDGGEGVLETTAAQVLVDFTAPPATMRFVEVCRRRRMAMVVGCTGVGEAEVARLRAAGGDVAVVWAQNMSVGVHALYEVAAFAARALGAGRLGGGFDVEVVEEHHRHKRDAPSGTALRLGRALAEATGGGADDVVCGRCGAEAGRGDFEVGVAAVRGGDVVGTHRVLFAGAGEQFEIVHRAASRVHYAAGAVRAAKFAAAAAPGFYDGMGAVLAGGGEG